MNKILLCTHLARSAQTRVLFLVTVVFYCGSSATTRGQLLTNFWEIAPGSRTYIGSSNTERGVAFNPATRNVLLVSRAGGVNIYVLDGGTGTELWQLNTDSSIVFGSAPGGFALNMVGVAEDGVVYAANLTTGPGSSSYKVYRWATDNVETVPAVAFDGDPAGTNEVTGVSNNAQRWGDSFDVRGSGTNTMIVAASRASTVVAVFVTEDGLTFKSTIITNAASASGTIGVAFGASNTLWLKLNGQALRHVSFDLATGQSTLLQSFANPNFPNAVAPIGVNVASNWLGAIAIETPDNFRLYDISDLTIPPAFLDRKDLPTDTANGNGVGSVDFGSIGDTNLVFVLDTNNGLVAYRMVPALASAPIITAQPQNLTVLVGAAAATFSVTAVGTVPLLYRWRFGETDIPGATKSSLTITNPLVSDSGTYSVVVSNSVDSTTSSNAVLTVEPLVQSGALTELWRIAPGDRPYVTTANTERGVALNPLTGNALLVSRAGGANIYVLDGGTGEELRRLNVDPSIVFGSAPAGFELNMIGVADDGAVYAANLTTDSGTTQLAIYRWNDDSSNAIPTVAYLGDPSDGNIDMANRRFGDSFAVRGAGANTQILLGSRNGRVASILTTLDGFNFTATAINTDATAGDFGLSVAFGSSNSFWGKAFGSSLRLIEFDLAAGTGITRNVYTTTQFRSAVSPIGINVPSNWLAAVAIEIPDNLRLYDISNLANPPVLIDQRLFPADNENANGTGSIDFKGNRLYAVDSNNGVLAYTAKALTTQLGPINAGLSGDNLILQWNGPGSLQSSTNLVDGFGDVSGATSPYTNSITSAPQMFFRLRN